MTHATRGIGSGGMLPLAMFFFLSALGLALVFRLVGIFSPPWVLALSAALTVWLARCSSSSRGPVNPWLLAGLSVLGLLYMGRPGEYLAGNWDPGVNLAQGVSASSSRGWTLPDTVAAQLPDEGRFEIYPLQRGEPVKTPGFYAPFKKPGVLVPQFFPLYSSLLALLSWLGGLSLVLRADALCILLAALLLADTATRMSARPAAAFIVLGLFGLHPALIWFARFQTVESISLLLWVMLLWTGSQLLTEYRLRTVLLACLNALLLPWSSPVALPVSMGTILLAALPGRARAPRIALAVSSLFGVFSLLIFLRVTHHPYGRQLLRLLPDTHDLRAGFFKPLLWLLPVGMVLFFVLLYQRPLSRINRPLVFRAEITWKLVFVTLLTVFATVLSFRWLPRIPPAANGLWALLPLPFWAWAGWGWARTNERQPAFRLWNGWVMTIAMAIGLLFAIWPAMPLLYPWTWKRWIWIVFPTIALYAGMGLSFLSVTGIRRAVLDCALVLLLLALPLYHHYALMRGSEWRGLSDWLAQLSSRIPDRAIVLAPPELATPLEFVFGHTVAPLYEGEKTRRDFFYLDLWDTSSPERPVMAIAETKPAWLTSRNVHAQSFPPYKGAWIQPNRLPFGFRRQKRGFDVFLWTPDAPPSDPLPEPTDTAPDNRK